jgi:hypothetical protein
MSLSSHSRALFVLIATGAAAPAFAHADCKVGDVCVLQGPQFGCKEQSLIRRWIDLSIEESREAAESFLSEQAAAGQCARFKTGDELRIIRYLGMRRVEAQRPGDGQSFVILLK